MMKILIPLLLLSRLAVAAPTVARVAHPQGRPATVVWNSPSILISNVEGSLPAGVIVSVEDGIATFLSNGNTLGAWDTDLWVTYDWMPVPQWGWPVIPVRVEVNVKWCVYGEPEYPFGDGFGDTLILPDP